MGHSDLQTSVAHISMFLATRNALTSSNKKLGRRCFDYISGRFGDQEMLLSINLDDKSVLQNIEAIWTSSYKEISARFLR